MLKVKAESRKRISEILGGYGVTDERQKLLFKSGSVGVSGRIKKADTVLKAGDTLYVDGLYPELKPESLVVYNDENFFVMSKPGGMDCITRRDTGRETLYGFAAEYMKSRGEYDMDRLKIPYICEQVDKRSGGLVMIAKNEENFGLLMQAVKERRIVRILNAYVGAIPRKSSGELMGFASSVIEDENITVYRKQEKGTVPVVTRYRVIDSNVGVSLIEATCLNGGVSVMRAQLAANGMPVIGDKEYGKKTVNSRFNLENPAIAVERFIFSTGTNNPLEYLNLKTVSSDKDELPELRLKKGGSRRQR